MFIKKNGTLLIGALILGLAAIVGAIPAGEEIAPATSEREARLVRVASVETSDGGRSVRIPGVTRSVRRAELSFTISGRLAERPVQVGDPVRAGQLIARLDGRELVLAERAAAASLAEIEVRLAQARTDQARVARLVSAKAATTEELESLQAGTASLDAALDAAGARLADRRRLVGETGLRAPFDGVVTMVGLEPGEWASPGSTIVEIAGSDRIEVRVDVPESIRRDVTPGSPAEINLPMSGIRVAGVVSSVAFAAAGPGELFPVTVELEPAAGITAGQTAEVTLNLEGVPELTVPVAAVLDSGGSRPSVFRVAGGVATRVAIVPGRVVGERLTITSSDLTTGDHVVVRGHTALVDGDRVETR